MDWWLLAALALLMWRLHCIERKVRAVRDALYGKPLQDNEKLPQLSDADRDAITTEMAKRGVFSSEIMRVYEREVLYRRRELAAKTKAGA